MKSEQIAERQVIPSATRKNNTLEKLRTPYLVEYRRTYWKAGSWEWMYDFKCKADAERLAHDDRYQDGRIIRICLFDSDKGYLSIKRIETERQAAACQVTHSMRSNKASLKLRGKGYPFMVDHRDDAMPEKQWSGGGRYISLADAQEAASRYTDGRTVRIRKHTQFGWSDIETDSQ